MSGYSLGALLGTNQSFDDLPQAGALPPGWQSSAFDQASFFLVAGVHSSAWGLLCHAFSTGLAQPGFSFAYGGTQPFFSQVQTHTLRARFWFRAGGADSGSYTARLWTSSLAMSELVLPADGMLHAYDLAGLVTSHGLFPLFQVARTGGHSQTSIWWLDDVLVEADPIPLVPGWDLKRTGRWMGYAERSGSAKMFVGAGAVAQGFQLSLSWLSDSHAAQLNEWWQEQHRLVFHENSADPEAVMICRLGGSRQPVWKRVTGESDRWEGTLTLEGLTGGELSFR